jgi:gliding motility-associated-like protein
LIQINLVMKKEVSCYFKLSIAVILFFVSIEYSQAQITSTFDADVDGWILRNNGDNLTATIVQTSTGGNPGGYISGDLPFDNYPAFFWYAPAKFLGNLTYNSFGQTLSYSQQQLVTGDNGEYNGNYYEIYSADLVISSGGTSIYYHTSPKPTLKPAWSNYSVTLDESSAWRTGEYISSALATRSQIKAVLQNVTELRIRGNYNNTANTVSLDQVSLGQRPLATPLTISNISVLSGNPGSTLTITGSNFGASITDNKVYFGSIEAQISSASATSITVTVPVGAAYEKITVINTTTGVSKQSLKPFNPTFDSGGRIIPASFKPKIDFPLDAGNTIRGITVADIDGDGWNDLLVAEAATNSVLVFLNLGTGGTLSASTFAPKITLAGAGNGSGLRVIDLDGDGKQDIATEYSDGFLTSFATFRNTSTIGNPSFEAVELWAGLVYSGPLSAVEDIDGDGRFDLIGQHGNGSVFLDFWIAQNISSPGNIEFGASVSYFGGATLDAGAGVSTGDLDNDGIPEIIVKHNFGGQFQIIKNNSTPGTISLGTPFPIVQSSNGGIVIADFNLDGKNDLAWKQGYYNDDVHIRLNTNNGGALTATDFGTEIILASELSTYGAISMGDINGDGKPDILISDSQQVGVFENIFDGGAFTASSFIESYAFEASGNSTYPTGIIAADLNGDQKPEMVVGITNTNPVRILLYENKNIHAPVISLNTIYPLKGAVGSTVTITGSDFSTIPTENSVRFGATKATVLTATKTQLTVTVPPGATLGLVSVTRNNLTARYHLPFIPTFGPGIVFDNTHFSPPVSFTLTTADYDIAVADLNNDGKPDVLAEGQTSRAYSFLNTHTGGSITTSSLTANDTTVNSTQNPVLIDFDEDGLLDIMSTSGAYRNISSIGKIDFAPLTNFGSGSNHSFGDFNRDGKTDVLGANGTSISIAENRSIQPGPFLMGSYPTLSPIFNYSKPATGGGTASVDIDNDGWKDVAATNPGTDNVTVWRNNGEFRISTTDFTAQPVIAVGDNPGRIYEGDLDVDGKMDLMLYYSTGTSSTMITVLHNQSTTGNIIFNRVDYTIPGAATVAHISDLDGDGKPEIIVTSESTDKFFILKNTSTPGTMNASSFATPFATAVNNPRGLSSGDLNADGKPEIIITSQPNSLMVFENLIPTTSIVITQQPATPLNSCSGSAATLSTDASGTTNITYQWQKFNSGTSLFENLVNNTTFSGVTTKTLSIANVTSAEGGNYRCLIKGDLVADVTTNVSNVVFNNLPSPPDVVSSTSCGPGSVTLTASGGSPGDYQWYTTSPLTLISGETNETYTTPVLSTSTQYAVSVSGPFCKSLPANATAFINPLLAKPVITSSVTAVGNAITICSTTTLTLSAPAGFTDYLWSDGSIAQQISVTTAGTYSVVVKDAQGCSSPASDGLTVTVVAAPCNNSAPVINTTSVTTTIGGQVSINLLDLISDVDDNLVSSSLIVIVQPTSGATTTITNGILLIDYTGTNFTGTDQLTIQVCDVFGECVQQQLEIKVIGELIIYNAVSPNGDSKNEIFRLEYIDLIPETQNNKVTIYNRWGSKVFEVENYNNNDRVFKGLNDNGNELPSGTYFYKIAFDSGKKSESGI